MLPESPLPNELLLQIFSHLGPRELISADRVNRLFYAAARLDSLWKRIYFLTSRLYVHQKDEQTCWRTEFVNFSRYEMYACNLSFYIQDSNLTFADFSKIKFTDLYQVKLRDEKLMDYLLSKQHSQERMDRLYSIVNRHMTTHPETQADGRITYLTSGHNLLGYNHCSEYSIIFSYSMLRWAVIFNQLNYLLSEIESIKQLYKAGASEQRTYLQLACRHGHVDIVSLLIQAGAKIDEADDYQRTPLMFASKLGHLSIVQLLLNAQANVNAKDQNKRRAIYFAAQGGHTAILALLLANGAWMTDPMDPDEVPPLMMAAQVGHEESVRFLLTIAADVNAKNRVGRTALWLASDSGFVSIIGILLSHHATAIEAVDNHHWTALCIATYNGHYQAVKLLLQNNANPDGNDHVNFSTPLFAAAHQGFANIVLELLNHGSNTSIRYHVTCDLLRSNAERHESLNSMNYYIAEAIQHGEGPNSITMTAFDIAVIYKQSAVIQLLANKVRSIDHLTSKPTLLAVIAASHGDLATVHILGKYATPFNQATATGLIPIEIATEKGETKVIEAMQRYIDLFNVCDQAIAKHSIFAMKLNTTAEDAQHSLRMGV